MRQSAPCQRSRQHPDFAGQKQALAARLVVNLLTGIDSHRIDCNVVAGASPVAGCRYIANILADAVQCHRSVSILVVVVAGKIGIAAAGIESTGLGHRECSMACPKTRLPSLPRHQSIRWGNGCLAVLVRIACTRPLARAPAPKWNWAALPPGHLPFRQKILPVPSSSFARALE